MTRIENPVLQTSKKHRGQPLPTKVGKRRALPVQIERLLWEERLWHDEEKITLNVNHVTKFGNPVPYLTRSIAVLALQRHSASSPDRKEKFFQQH